MGGVPPLSSSAGLPSYEEAAREGREKSSEHLKGVPAVRSNGSESVERTRRSMHATLDQSASMMEESAIRGRRETVSDTDFVLHNNCHAFACRRACLDRPPYLLVDIHSQPRWSHQRAGMYFAHPYSGRRTRGSDRHEVRKWYDERYRRLRIAN